MGLGPGLVVVKRSSHGVEVGSTRGQRKVRVRLPYNASSCNASRPAVLIFLPRPGITNSKYLLRIPRLGVSCYSNLAPSRHFLAPTHVTPVKTRKISSVSRGNLLNRKLVTKIRLNTAPSHRRSMLQSTPRIATGLLLILTNLLGQPKKNPNRGRQSSRPGKWLSRNWKRTSARIPHPCSHGLLYCPTQSPQSR